jgi:hypothetical protein
VKVKNVLKRRIVVNKVVMDSEEGGGGRGVRDGRESRAFLKGLIL